MTLNNLEQPITAISRYKHITVACTFILLILEAQSGPAPRGLCRSLV